MQARTPHCEQCGLAACPAPGRFPGLRALQQRWEPGASAETGPQPARSWHTVYAQQPQGIFIIWEGKVPLF